MLMVASWPSWGPTQDRQRWAEDAVWLTALPEGPNLADPSLVNQSGKLAPVEFGQEASRSSAGENA